MEYGSRWRTALFILLGVTLLFLGVWGVTSIARSLFGPTESSQTTTTQKALTEYAKADTSVRLHVGGPIVANEKYVSYDIEVTQTTRKITTYKTFQNVVTSVKSYDNNQEAYLNFLTALQINGYLTKANSATTTDSTAQCSTGKRYTYYLYESAQVKSDLWSTSCNGRVGTLGGNGSAIRSLYQAQIPDFNTIVTGDYSTLR